MPGLLLVLPAGMVKVYVVSHSRGGLWYSVPSIFGFLAHTRLHLPRRLANGS